MMMYPKAQEQSPSQASALTSARSHASHMSNGISTSSNLSRQSSMRTRKSWADYSSSDEDVSSNTATANTANTEDTTQHSFEDVSNLSRQLKKEGPQPLALLGHRLQQSQELSEDVGAKAASSSSSFFEAIGLASRCSQPTSSTSQARAAFSRDHCQLGEESSTSQGADWSEGSEQHSGGKCRPCIFYRKVVGCENGRTCSYCHLEHERRPRHQRHLRRSRNKDAGELGEVEHFASFLLPTALEQPGEGTKALEDGVGLASHRQSPEPILGPYDALQPPPNHSIRAAASAAPVAKASSCLLSRTLLPYNTANWEDTEPARMLHAFGAVSMQDH